MTLLEIAVLIVMGYIAVFGLVNRICTCFERCHGMDADKKGE